MPVATAFLCYASLFNVEAISLLCLLGRIHCDSFCYPLIFLRRLPCLIPQSACAPLLSSEQVLAECQRLYISNVRDWTSLSSNAPVVQAESGTSFDQPLPQGISGLTGKHRVYNDKIAKDAAYPSVLPSTGDSPEWETLRTKRHPGRDSPMDCLNDEAMDFEEAADDDHSLAFAPPG